MTAAMLRLRAPYVQMPYPIQRLRSRLLRSHRSHRRIVRPSSRLRLVGVHGPSRQVALLLSVPSKLRVELSALGLVHAGLVRLLLPRAVNLDEFRLENFHRLAVLGSHVLSAFRTHRPRAKRRPALAAGNLLRLLLERRLTLLNLLLAV